MSSNDTKCEYAVTIKNPPAQRGEFEIAEVLITNRINNKDYVYTVWGDDETLEDPFELGGTYVFLHDLTHLRMDDISNWSKKELEEILEDEISEYPLHDFIEVDHSLIQLLKSDNEFSQKIDNINLDFINYLLVEREIVEMTYKAHSEELTKQDILDFGKLLGKKDYYHFKDNAFTYLEEPVGKVLKNVGVKKTERKLIEKAFEVLQLDTSNLPKEKNYKKEMKVR